MCWYFFILFLLGIPTILFIIGQRHHVQLGNVSLAISCCILCFFMALRDTSVGADTQMYERAFMSIRKMNIVDLFQYNVYIGKGYYLDLEIGYKIYNRILAVLSEKAHFITSANSIFITCLLYAFVKKNSKNPILSIWLYITLGFFQTEMNMARNAIAIFICYHSLLNILTKRPVKYILGILIASMFHFSSIIFLPLYWLIHLVRLDERGLRTMLIVAMGIGAAFPLFKGIVYSVIPTKYYIYFMESSNRKEGLLLGFLYIFVLGTVLIFMKKRYRTNAVSYCIVGNWMFILCIVGFCIGFSLPIGTRIAALFGPYLIVYIPEMIHYGYKSKSKRKLITTGIVVICVIQYILRLNINNIGATMPYLFEYPWNLF